MENQTQSYLASQMYKVAISYQGKANRQISPDGVFLQNISPDGVLFKNITWGLFSTYFAWVIQQTAIVNGEFAGQSHVAWKTPVVMANSCHLQVSSPSSEFVLRLGNRQFDQRFGFAGGASGVGQRCSYGAVVQKQFCRCREIATMIGDLGFFKKNSGL